MINRISRQFNRATHKLFVVKPPMKVRLLRLFVRSDHLYFLLNIY